MNLPEIELASNDFQSMPDDSNRLPKLEVQDRSVQADSQAINAQLGKQDMIRNKVRQKFIKDGRPMCPTNCCVDMPCVVIVIGTIILSFFIYFCLANNMFKMTPEHPR